MRRAGRAQFAIVESSSRADLDTFQLMVVSIHSFAMYRYREARPKHTLPSTSKSTTAVLIVRPFAAHLTVGNAVELAPDSGSVAAVGGTTKPRRQANMG